MTNAEIAQHFSLLADLLELHGENPFKIKSYTNAAGTIKDWPVALESISDDDLYRIPGVGQAIAEKIRQLQQTGMMNALQKVMDSTPEGVRNMLKIDGISPKKAGIIWRELGIDTIEALKAAALENRIAPLKGFGAKTQESIAAAVAFYKSSIGYFMWAKAEHMMLQLAEQLRTAFPKNRFEPTGAMRRQEDVVHKIDMLTDAPADEVQEYLLQSEHAGLIESEGNYLAIAMNGWPDIAVHFCTSEEFYSRLFETTGSGEFLAAFHEKYTAGKSLSEEEIFTENGLAFIPAVLRNHVGSLQLSAGNTLPELIQTKDIKGLIHSHSTYSDGAATLEQMALAARDRGLEYMVISDHSQAAQYASGLYPDRIEKQHREIDELNAQLAPFKIFKSIEVDILADGNLDYNPAVLSSLDLVIASVHSTLKMEEARAMKRLLKAIENPFTTILGHMTGRLLLRRPGYPVNHKKIIDACAANQVVIEINANPRRLDIDSTWIPYALERGVLLSINPDAHSVAGIDDIKYGVIAAQKGGLTAKHNLSSFSLAEFEAFLEKSRQKR